MPIQPSNNVQRHPLAGTNRYGAASVRDFDNPLKWTTVQSVPVLDEHELTDDNGKIVGYVDQRMLSEIAQNNNKRVIETNDPAPLIVGHTSDDPQAPERPVAGYAVNYTVKPFKRDPKTGRTVYAIHADYKVRKDREQVIEDFPRRSVELWLGRKELDPIALLGGTTPERDLGVIIRKSRITGITMDGEPKSGTVREELDKLSESPVLRYSKRTGTVIRYASPQPGSIEDDGDEQDDEQAINYSCGDDSMKPMKGKNSKPPGMKTSKKKLYEAGADDEMETDDLDAPPSDFGGDNPHDEPESDPAGDDPAVAAIFQSKQFIKMLQTAVQSAIEGLLAAEEGGAGAGGPPMGPGAGGPPPMGEPDGDEGSMGPEGADGLAPQPDEEARIDHEAPPVRFGANTGYAGPQSTFVPTPTGTKGTRYSRTNHQSMPQGNQPMPRTQQRQDPEVVRLRRQVNDLLIRNARVEAEKVITDFMTNAERDPEGPVVFNDPEAEVEMLASMDQQSREYHIENIRRNYRRQGSSQGPMDPTNNGAVNNLMRYGRSSVGQPEQGGEGDEENYMPQTPAEAVAIADAQAGRFGKQMTAGEAIKYLRGRGVLRPSRNGTPRGR